MILRSIHHYTIIYVVLTTLLMLFPIMSHAEKKSVDICNFSDNDNDLIIVHEDTITSQKLPKEYQLLKEKSSKNKWTKELFSLVVNEPKTGKKQDENNDPIPDYQSFRGKIIRNINITVLSPFGTNISDPEQKSDKWKFLNESHMLTRESTIKKILQFKAGSGLNPALLMDSEAQLRNTQYIYDARILVDSISNTKDSVDIEVIVRDKWTLGMDIHRLSTSNVNLEIFDGNILGSGSRAGVYFIYSDEYKRKFGYGVSYLYENISNSNINLGGEYVDEIDSYNLSVSAVRNLQTKLNLFGEISYDKRVHRPGVFSWDSLAPERREVFSITLGRAFTLSQQNSIKRFALSLRYLSKKNSYDNPIFKEHIKDILLPYKYVNNRILLMQASLYRNAYRREYMVLKIIKLFRKRIPPPKP